MRACFVFTLCLLAAACSRRADQREYVLQGQVITVAADRRQATITHAEIKGFMPAMTMPYDVHDRKQLDDIAPGDLVNAKLVVLSNDAYLSEVKKVGQAPLPPPPADAAAPPVSSKLDLLRPGDAVPDASFIDQDGRKRTFRSFQGTTVVLTFIYTRCPIPTFCPLMDQHFAVIQKKVNADATLNGRVHLVTVTFDPESDTPSVLKAHARTVGADFKNWTFLTGRRADIDPFSARFGIAVARASADPRDVTHNLRTAIVDGNGTLVKVYVGNEWTTDQVLADLAPVAVKGKDKG